MHIRAQTTGVSVLAMRASLLLNSVVQIHPFSLHADSLPSVRSHCSLETRCGGAEFNNSAISTSLRAKALRLHGSRSLLS